MGSSTSRLSRRQSRQNIGKGNVTSTGDGDYKQALVADSKSGIEDFMPKEDTKLLGVRGSKGSCLHISPQESSSNVEATEWPEGPPAYHEIYKPREKNYDALK